MATIYRFIIENGGSGGARSSGGGTKGAAKKGKWVSLLNSNKGGVEHNRKLRAINPVLNKATGGAWEKGMRLGRAGLGLVQTRVDSQGNRHFRLSTTAFTIIIAFVLQELMKWWKFEQQKADKINSQNFKQMENGYNAVHGAYSVGLNIWTGQRTFNENK